MMKVVVNRCYGGFGLSRKAIDLYAKKLGKTIYRYKQNKYKWQDGEDEFVKVNDGDEVGFIDYTFTVDHGDSFNEFPTDGYFYDHDIKRDDETLIAVVEELKHEANGNHAKLEIVEIPDGVSWEIEEYDGRELVSEQHRTW